MSTDFDTRHDPAGPDAHDEHDEHDEQVVELRYNFALHAVVGGAALLLGFGYLVRGSAFDVLVGLVLLVIAGLNVPALVSRQAPLLVLDEQGIRFRIGLSWRGLPWPAVRQVVLEEPTSLLRDGRLVIVARDPDAVLGDLDRIGRAHLRWNQFWYGAPISLPVGITTTTGPSDLAAELKLLGDGRTEIVVVTAPEPAPAEVPSLDQRAHEELDGEDGAEDFDDFGDVFRAELHGEAPAAAPAVDGPVLDGPVLDGPVLDSPVTESQVLRPVPTWVGPAEQPVPEEPDELFLPAAVLPLRDLSSPARVDVRLEEPVVPAQRDAGSPDEVAEYLELATWDHEAPVEIVLDRDTGDTDEPASHAQTLVAVGDEPEPTRSEPVIGVKILHAREMLDMSIDELSQRTRIRPHVLEAIELDDFGPCGGDFYARGHLTAISRVLGLSLDPLMKVYDERYAQAPINARRVFEAELSTGLSGGMRATLGGPRWSLVVGAVLSLTMVWALARIFAGDPAQLNAAPDPGSASAGLAANHQPITSPRMQLSRMSVTASHAAVHVVVRDRTGKVLWSGPLALGKHRKVVGLAPFKVTTDDAGAVEVSVKGKPLGTVGTAGESGTKAFG